MKRGRGEEEKWMGRPLASHLPGGEGEKCKTTPAGIEKGRKMTSREFPLCDGGMRRVQQRKKKRPSVTCFWARRNQDATRRLKEPETSPLVRKGRGGGERLDPLSADGGERSHAGETLEASKKRRFLLGAAHHGGYTKYSLCFSFLD